MDISLKISSYKLAFVLFSLILSVFLTSCSTHQAIYSPTQAPATYHPVPTSLSISQIDSLKSIYGKNKIFCPEFLEPTLIALSYYPELKKTPIEFKYARASTTMAARPVIHSLFHKRKYVVIINDKTDFDGILLKDAPNNAQIGILGHELAHILDYEQQDLAGVIKILFRYIDKNTRGDFEKEIDRLTIQRGLGWPLYDWACYSMEHCPKSTPEYKAYKKKYYLTPLEIKEMIRTCNYPSISQE